MSASRETQDQRHYYAQTAASYEDVHVHGDDEHYFALCLLLGAIDHFGFKSILDIGSGTGRAISFLKARRPDLMVMGIEPVAELREVGYRQGIAPSDLVDGDATQLRFEDNAFDVVCEFGVLHHIRHPERAVVEMLRVARRAVFISDSNNFGQGRWLRRSMKQVLNLCGLWNIANFIRTGGKGYTVSDGDGLAYSYSVFNNYQQIRRECSRVHLLNTIDGGINVYRTASHLALLGIKREA